MPPSESSRAAEARGYLDTPSMGLAHPDTVTAMRTALDEWAAGRAEHATWERSMESCRRSFAQLVDVGPDDVGLLASVVPAVSAAAAVLATRRGTVVVHRREFRSLLLPVLAQIEQERLRWVDGPYIAETFASAMDEQTAAVVLSAVSSHDGGRPALTRLATLCDDVGAQLVVDATQAVGLVVPDVPPDELFLFTCAGYKGLRGPRGVAYAVADDAVSRASLAPSAYGMADAAAGSYGPPLRPRRGGPGLDQSPAWLAWVGAAPALAALLREPASQRERHVTSLAQTLRGELDSCGLPAQQSDLPSPIVTFEHPDALGLTHRLAACGVRAATRLGRVRIGFHVHNDEDDVDVVSDVLRRPM